MQRECRRDSIDELDAELIAGSLRTALLVEPSEATAERHLTAMRLAVAAVARADQERLTERRHRRARIKVVWAAAVSSLALAVSGMAAAGALPGLAQHDAARVAAIVRIHVPDTAAKVAPAAPAALPVVAHDATKQAAAPPPARVHTPAPKPAPATHTHVSAAAPKPSHVPTAKAPVTRPQVPVANPPHTKQPGHKKNGHWKRHHHKHKKHHGGTPPPTTKQPAAFGPKNG